jgi:hypothetical protein
MGNRTTEPLRRGNAFHARVQTAFLAGLLGAEAAPERPVTLSLGLDPPRYAVTLA